MREDIEKTELIRADENDKGMRLDAFLSQKSDELSRNYAQKLIDNGKVTVNGREEASKKYKVMPEDTIVISYPVPEVLDAKPENIPLDIVYEDDDVIVVNKKRGMVVHPSAGNYNGTLVNALMYHCGDRLSSINGEIRPGIVHRIDKDTSGLLVIAKNDKAHESLAEQFKEHSLTRKYIALVYDNIKDDEITIDEPIGRDEGNRLRRAVFGSNPKDAITHIEVLKRYGKYTLVAARLETGRTHQIRVHMAYIKHPLVGDALYGPKNPPFKADGQMLHAKTLGFIHPSTGKYIEFDSELPDWFQDNIRKVENISNV